jgi:adenosylcobinamide-GDP ribazoletransferase
VNALRLAFGLLTAVPVGGLPRVDRRAAGVAMLLAPVTTVPMLAVLAGLHLLVVHAGLPPLVAAVGVVGSAALLTRAMHLDGLADTADGLSATGDRAARLAAMKASDVGPSGVAALVLVLLLQAACLAPLLTWRGGLALASVAYVTSRLALAWACRPTVPPATPGGLGAMVAGSVPWVRAAMATVVVLALGAVAGVVTGIDWWAGPLVVITGLVAGGVLLAHCTRRLGGVTGDVLGAVVESSLAGALVAAALLGT